MGIDKQGSKGGYVGGFFQLFDWNGKSRKKLFANKSDLPEGSKHRKRSEGTSPVTQHHLIDEDHYGRLSFKESSDYSCASSVTDEEGNGTRAPNVVARLMGLDCLPASGVAEPYSSPNFECRSLRDAHYRRTPDFSYENRHMHSSNRGTELEGFPRMPLETRPQKVYNRPIDRFQTEMLPPKSAKSIPITHHKLLSPIKNPGFMPTKNAAQIMEEAAKIIEGGSQANNKAKMQPLGSPTVPLKFRELKEKVEGVHRPLKYPEASQRPIESNAFKQLKGQSLNKSWNGVEDTSRLRNPLQSEDRNSAASNKGKSISLAIQAKVNVQRREGLSSTNNRTALGQKEHYEIRSNKSVRNQVNIQKGMQKKPSTDRASGVLRQNNQKQNCLTNRDNILSKPSVPNQQSRKPLSAGASSSRNKSSNNVAGPSRVGSRRNALEVKDGDKEVAPPTAQTIPRKRRSLERDFCFEKNPSTDTVLVNRKKLPIQSKVSTDGQLNWADEKRMRDMDVVSFTFTSPLKKSVPGSQSSGLVVEKNINFCLETEKEKVSIDGKDTRSSSQLEVIGGDALSILLEQKIRELTHGAESSCPSASCLQDLVSDFSAKTTTPREDSSMSQLGSQTDEFDSLCDSSCSSNDAHKLEGTEEVGDCCSSSNQGTRKEFSRRHPSPVSILEPSSSNESCSSSDSGDSYNMNGGKQLSSDKTQNMINSSCIKRFSSVEAAECSDSTYFSFTGVTSGEQPTRLIATVQTRPDAWELDYVREILCNAELMFKDFALGRAREIINPHLFDQLENRKTWSVSLPEDEANECRLERKTLFACVGESLDLRCRRYVGGGSKKWAKGLAMVRRKEWLADEVYKEISGWRDMKEWDLDEVVDKDMSTQHGSWLDYGIEEFEVGVEIERRILSSMIDEVVFDMLLL